MATLQELETALVNADKAGDSTAAKILAREITNRRALESTGLGAGYRPQTSIDPPQPGARARMGRGFMDPVQGVKQFALERTDPEAAKEYTKQTDEEIALYNRGRGEHAGFDGFRLAGNVAAGTVPAAALAAAAPAGMVAGVGGRMALGGIQGAVQGGMQYVPEGGSRGVNTALGTAGGVAGAGAGELISRAMAKLTQGAMAAGRRLTTSPDDIVQALKGELQRAGADWDSLDAGIKSSLMAQARKQLTAGGELSPDMLVRKMEMDEVLGPGAGGTMGQVTRDPRQWTFERNTQKLETGFLRDGDPSLTQRYQAQLQRLNQRLSDAVAAKQAKAQNAYQAGDEAIGAVQQKMKDSGRVVDDLYAVWRETGAGATEVKGQKLAAALDDIIDERGIENISPIVRARLESFGLTKATRRLSVDEADKLLQGIFDGQELADLQQVVRMADNVSKTMGKESKPFTIAEAEKLRRLINNNIDPAKRPQMAAMLKLKDAVDEAVLDTDAPDIPSLQAARRMAAERFGMRDSAPAVTAAAEGVEPDKFFRRFVLNGDVRDLQGLKATLNTGVTGAKPTPGMSGYEPQGAGAWRDLQAQTLRHLLEKAQGAKPGDFSGYRINKAMKELGDERLKVIFDPEQLASLKKLARVADNVTTEPPFAAVNQSNTAPTLMQYAGDVTKKITNMMPFVKPVMLPFIGAYEAGSKGLQNTAMRQKVQQALTGAPVSPTGASDAYARLAKMMADRMDPLAASGSTAGLLYQRQDH